MATPADDPIRQEVERVLQAIVGVTVVAPVRLATAVPRCVLRRVARCGPLVEPLRVVRSLVDLAGAGLGARGVVSPDDAPLPREEAVVAAPSGPPAGEAPTVHLPIEDYESLAASHVVDRLPTLTPAELAQVQAFEAAHRGRRTILGRIEQLLA
jgi:hypothetical protein